MILIDNCCYDMLTNKHVGLLISDLSEIRSFFFSPELDRQLKLWQTEDEVNELIKTDN